MTTSKGDSKTLRTGAKILIVLNTLFILAISLSGVFVNVYIWKIGQNIRPVAVFNLFQFLSIPLFYTMAGWLSKHKDRKVSLRIGVALYALFYLSVLLLRERTVSFLGPLGLLLGAGAGFFYLALAVIMYDLTNDGNRDYFTGMITSWASTTAMVAPFASGWFISRYSTLSGYSVVFLASLFLLVVVVVVSFLLYSRPTGDRFQLGKVLFSRNGGWRAILGLTFLEGFRTGTMSFLLGILVYASVKNELALGGFASATSLLTTLTSYLSGRFAARGNRLKFILAFVAGSAVGYSILAWDLTTTTILVFGLSQGIVGPLFAIPFQALTFGVVDQDPDCGERRVEYMVSKELILNSGRILGIVLFLFLAGDKMGTTAARAFAVLLVPVPLFMYCFSVRLQRFA